VFYNNYYGKKKLTVKEYWNIKSILDEKISNGVGEGYKKEAKPK